MLQSSMLQSSLTRSENGSTLAKLCERYMQARRFSEQLCEPLSVEDQVVQAMPDASPTKWHLAHTSWFFETFVLARWEADYRPLNHDYQVLFNSYYNSVGEQYPRPRRGLLTRPSVADVFAYRHEVDKRVERLLDKLTGEAALEAARIVETGIQHEQQHQELILTDIKYLFSCNPLRPPYRAVANAVVQEHGPGGWSRYDGDVVEVGYSGQEFCFDNERPDTRCCCTRSSSMSDSSATASICSSSMTMVTSAPNSGYRSAGIRSTRRSGKRPCIG